jgi:diaminohydroxyphosphoribosylaminopyrimidine deaminase/5-amino-6-(5-phosphoribosylamino)uracil reductase
MSAADYMRLALRLARRGYGQTSPNPMVGAVLVKRGEVIGQGWHRRAGAPHAEIEALRDAEHHQRSVRGATLYVTLEPCSTQGRTPPCTDALIAAGLRQVWVGATDPNPRHCGRGFALLRRAGLEVVPGVLAEDCARLNEAFNHWIVRRTPFVTVKAAMTLDGKIATAAGESKWITAEPARRYAMQLRQGADAILVGINTVLADDPSLTVRPVQSSEFGVQGSKFSAGPRQPQRIVLDALARTPLQARLIHDEQAALTTIVVGETAPKNRLAALAERVNVLIAPVARASSRLGVARASRPWAPQLLGSSAGRGFGARGAPKLDLGWLLEKLGAEAVTSLLVEGGGEVNASFLLGGLAQRVAFFYAPLILGGNDARPAIAGAGAENLDQSLSLEDVRWRKLGPDWFLTARVAPLAERAKRRS